jgi:hypothetical protein
MQTDALHPPTATTYASHSLIASDRVEGTTVRRSDGTRLGAIERLMIDKLSGNVVYAVFSFGGFLGMGQKHLPIPWARLKYDRTLAGYQLDLTDEELAHAPPSERRTILTGATAAGRSRSISTTTCAPIGGRCNPARAHGARYPMMRRLSGRCGSGLTSALDRPRRNWTLKRHS